MFLSRQTVHKIYTRCWRKQSWVAERYERQIWEYVHKKYEKCYYETSPDDAFDTNMFEAWFIWRAPALWEKGSRIIRWVVFVRLLFLFLVSFVKVNFFNETVRWMCTPPIIIFRKIFTMSLRTKKTQSLSLYRSCFLLSIQKYLGDLQKKIILFLVAVGNKWKTESLLNTNSLRKEKARSQKIRTQTTEIPPFL